MTIMTGRPFSAIAAGAMGATILIYVILDGFDLGIGILFAAANDAEKDRMISSIGPFWDANETWLVLAVGLLLVAFPKAHGVILTALYMPVFILLVGLILRGIAFDFRAKVPAHRRERWNRIFFAGSLTASLAQGYMLGVYVLGLETGSARCFLACSPRVPGGGLHRDGRGLADLQDRRRVAEEGRCLAAEAR
jgi:cytochrome d ubiquinol oxidase subunit II